MQNEAELESPQTSTEWKLKSDDQRVKLVEDVCLKNVKFAPIAVSRALEDGTIFVTLLEALPPHIRGTLLLDFEFELKAIVDPGLVVWCEPLGDKSTLRNLRGIVIRTERVTEPRR